MIQNVGILKQNFYANSYSSGILSKVYGPLSNKSETNLKNYQKISHDTDKSKHSNNRKCGTIGNNTILL